ncbi:hypothetical protein ABZ348_30460 [Streptomyces sp. NPDC005963]
MTPLGTPDVYVVRLSEADVVDGDLDPWFDWVDQVTEEIGFHGDSTRP